MKAGGALNPTWVELLMGWPQDWTCIKPMNYLHYYKWIVGYMDETKDGTTKELQDLWQTIDAEALWRTLGRLGCVETQKVLLPLLCKYSQGTNEAWLQLACKETPQGQMRSVRRKTEEASSPYQQRYKEQQLRQHPNSLQVVSRLLPSYGPKAWREGSWENGIDRVATGIPKRVDRLKALGNGWVPWVVVRILKVSNNQRRNR